MTSETLLLSSKRSTNRAHASKGTRLDAKDGKKIMTKVILPGQSLYIGSYVLTYGLGEAPSAANKKGGGMFSKMFGGRKK